MSSKLLVPDIGDFEKVEVIEVLVKEGDELKANDPVITIESDKSSVEIPSTLDGKIESLNIKVGDKVSKDDLILTVASNDTSSKDEKIIPKDTENLIREAEQALKEKEKKMLFKANKIITPEKPEIIQVINDGDIDPVETQEWLESLSAVIDKDGNHRAHYLIKELINKAYMQGVNIPYTQNTPYINTIPADEEKKSTGDQNIERRIRSFIRWNAAAMVVRANKKFPELGGHIGTFASAATLYDVGINHFFRAKNNKFGGDLVYFQGHSAPGMYARAYLEGRLNEKQLDNFRQEVKPGGLSSYPHPWLMPNFWQFPTVSMGLGPMLAIYQARYMKYLINRGLIKDEGRKVWAFLGDGEMDEPESLGAIGLAAREKLDNLIFVVNCNLQRLDGPVRGNGKIIQELEGSFRGAGWNVIKVIWGSYWDPLLANDKTGHLVKAMNETVDGEYQAMKARDGAYVREKFLVNFQKQESWYQVYQIKIFGG
jgi:pyruvate dehydrogenase E1 component